ncbi:hypothetical protein BV25DRAFT_1901029 [Artomyces pyxidatus]|uniref:Uncharacterized protein n=1 Tax=Artomyces pyxidatus TaxID=48021 RepID=A0ACB8SWT2_9AGAM|nr:hypothetical protein BV25DRAFT_1901029 [Artomyces pyxidatus]
MTMSTHRSNAVLLPAHPPRRVAMRLNVTALTKPKTTLDLDINADDGYILSDLSDSNIQDCLLPTPTPLFESTRSRRLRLKVKRPPMPRKVSGPPLGSISPTCSGFRFPDLCDISPKSPTSAKAQFKAFFDTIRARELRKAPATPTPASKLPVSTRPAPPPTTPLRQQPAPSTPHQPPTPVTPPSKRPVLRVQTKTTPQPPMESPILLVTRSAQPSPRTPDAGRFRPSGRLPKRSPIPIWPEEYYSSPHAIAIASH